MNNRDAIKSLCNAICNTFFPDSSAIEITAFNEGINVEEEAKPKDEKILKCAIALVRGYVEGSSSQNGISTSVRSQEAINDSIRHYCYLYGVDVADYGVEDIIIENISTRW